MNLSKAGDKYSEIEDFPWENQVFEIQENMCDKKCYTRIADNFYRLIGVLEKRNALFCELLYQTSQSKLCFFTWKFSQGRRFFDSKFKRGTVKKTNYEHEDVFNVE